MIVLEKHTSFYQNKIHQEDLGIDALINEGKASANENHYKTRNAHYLMNNYSLVKIKMHLLIGLIRC